MIIYSGSHVKETFASAFKSFVDTLAWKNVPVRFRLNVQDGDCVSMCCNYPYAYEYITFIDKINAEVSAHGVAIVVATDFRNDNTVTTIFVVCDDNQYQIKVNGMNDTRNIAIDALDNLDYRFGVFDDVLSSLDTDTLVDIALYLMRTYEDDAELEADELEQINEYANVHGIEG